jgi:hypothetical protein
MSTIGNCQPSEKTFNLRARGKFPGLFLCSRTTQNSTRSHCSSSPSTEFFGCNHHHRGKRCVCEAFPAFTRTPFGMASGHPRSHQLLKPKGIGTLWCPISRRVLLFFAKHFSAKEALFELPWTRMNVSSLRFQIGIKGSQSPCGDKKLSMGARNLEEC